jgi:hypothetical protein
MFRRLWLKARKIHSNTIENYDQVHDDSGDQNLKNNDSSNSKTSTIKIITDEPSLEDDALGFDSYAQKLSDIIINSTPRFAIGIFGGWGTGKTTLMKMIEKKLRDNHRNDILAVWFDAWKYEREKYLAIIPFIRTIEIELENKLIQLKESNARIERWNQVRKGFEKTFNAFIESTNLNVGLGNYGSAAIDLAKFRGILKSDGYSIEIDNETIYPHHKHITEYLVDALVKLRNPKFGGNDSYRIVVFIDDLDRCAPDKAVEVLESIKTFFDIEGFVYVIGMDSKSIDSIVKKKYENNFDKGLEYMEKIVQLPFQIPSWNEGWNEDAISDSIVKIISKGLKGSNLIEEFKNNKKLIVKAVRKNPREAKRFINNIILAKAVSDKNVDELIAVQALIFRHEWSNFLEFITENKRRKNFLGKYIEVTKGDYAIDKVQDGITKEFPEILEVHDSFFKRDDPLRKFLDVGAAKILYKIEDMKEYRRALDTVMNVKEFFIKSDLIHPDKQQGSPLAEDFTLYENPMYGIKIQYPADWIKAESPRQNETIISFTPKTTGSPDSSNSMAQFVIRVSTSQNKSLDEKEKELITEKTEQSIDFHVVDKAESTLAGNPARIITYTRKRKVGPRNSIKAVNYLTIKGDKAYILAYHEDESKYSNYFYTVEKMIDSFEFIK